MIVKTQAVLLHHVRHSDNSMVAQFYTREYGRLSVMVRGLSSKKSTSRHLYFQPMYLFELEIYYRDTKEIHNLKDLSLVYTPSLIPHDVVRSSIALFMSEVLYTLIREQEVNLSLYNFVEESVKALDSIQAGVSNFHLWFLVTLASYIGIGPLYNEAGGIYFDMLNGQFIPVPPLHAEYMEPLFTRFMQLLLQSDPGTLASLRMSGEERAMMLDQMIRYYNLHLPGMRRIRSLQVLSEIFRQT